MQEENKDLQAEAQSVNGDEADLQPVDGDEADLQPVDGDGADLLSVDGGEADLQPVDGDGTDLLSVTERVCSEDDCKDADASSNPAVRTGILLTKSRIAILVGAILALTVAATFVGMWINERKNDPWRVESGLVDYGDFSSPGGTSDQIVIPGYGEILLEADTRDVMLILPNPASNPCYFRFSILLKESNEVIYTSGLVPPGKAIESLTLKRDFTKGDYPAVIRIETFSLEDARTPMNGANVDVVLNFR